MVVHPLQVLFPFGYGLSYAEFEYTMQYDRLAPAPHGAVRHPGRMPTSHAPAPRYPAYAPCDSIVFAVDVANVASNVSGDEVVQMYVHIANASISPVAVRQLVAFQRVSNLQVTNSECVECAWLHGALAKPWLLCCVEVAVFRHGVHGINVAVVS